MGSVRATADGETGTIAGDSASGASRPSGQSRLGSASHGRSQYHVFSLASPAWTASDSDAFRTYLKLLGFVGATRVLELAHSRRNERRAGPAFGIAAARGFPAMVALHAALFVAPPAEILALHRRFRTAVSAPAALALIGATALRLWSIQALGDQWNVRGAVPASGRVVASGPYRAVRHPNYLAVALEMAALPLIWPALLSAAVLSLLNIAVLAPRIRAEERLLARLPGYTEAMAGRKRFIPCLF